MKRIFLGVLVGILVWGFFLLLSDFVWVLVSPDWYGKYQIELQSAISKNTPFTWQTSILVIVILRSLLYSMISGIITAKIAQENDKSTLILGNLLLLFGGIIHSLYWTITPFWFHFFILFFLIPVPYLSGKLFVNRFHRQKAETNSETEIEANLTFPKVSLNYKQ